MDKLAFCNFKQDLLLFWLTKINHSFQQVSSAEREAVVKSAKEPLALFDKKLVRTLSAQVIDEALTLSDLLTMSELGSVELLLEAEEQMQYFHGLNRGLTAILLYYDCKKMTCESLKMLTLVRSGRTWVFNDSFPTQITKFATEIIENQLQDGLVSKLLSKWVGAILHRGGCSSVNRWECSTSVNWFVSMLCFYVVEVREKFEVS